MAELYADEDFPLPVVERLRQLGHDVLTAFEAGQANQAIVDADQLLYATSLGRVRLLLLDSDNPSHGASFAEYCG